MDFKQLRYFLTVAEEGTISAAAKKLYMSQPPLTVQIHELELELGCRLFERTNRQIILTDAGRLLYARASSLLCMVQVTKEEVSDLGKNNTGTIRIGMISSVACTDISILIAKFLHAHPGVILDVHESNTYELLEQLRAKTIHMGIVRTPFSVENFKHTVLMTDHIMAVWHPGFFSLPKGQVSLQELAKQPLILYRRWEQIMVNTFNQRNLNLHIVCRNDDARTSLFFAEQGIGVALLPASAVGSVSNSVECHEIADNPWNTDIMLLYDESTYLPSCVKRLFSFLTENCGTLRGFPVPE